MSVQIELDQTSDAPTEIPVLDLGPYLAGEEGALDALAAELRHAQENVGFYFSINHGIPRGSSLARITNCGRCSPCRTRKS